MRSVPFYTDRGVQYLINMLLDGDFSRSSAKVTGMVSVLRVVFCRRRALWASHKWSISHASLVFWRIRGRLFKWITAEFSTTRDIYITNTNDRW